MERINLGEHEVVKKNYEYLLQAKEYGFFQNGFDPEDIASCDDWVVAWWIDEIGDLKKDKNKFVDEILPTFKRWASNGLDSTGVGCYYDFLKLAELNGIKIDSRFFDCVVNFDYYRQTFQKEKSISNDNSGYQLGNDYSNILNHFNSSSFIKNFKRWQNNGVPLTSETGELYDTFLNLEKKGEFIDSNTFMFFYTLKSNNNPSHLQYDFEYKKELEQRYGIKIFNGDEFLRLQDWVCYSGGYNSRVISELERTIERDKEKVSKQAGLNLFSNKSSRYLKKDVSVSFITISEQGEEKSYRIKGNLVDCNDNSVTILYLDKQSGEQRTIVIDDNDRSFIQSINLLGSVYSLYIGRSVNDRLRIQRNLLKIKEIEKEDIVSMYVGKYGTIKGLAYLKNHASHFIKCVDSSMFPINNLFTYCFENMNGFKFVTDEDLLRYTLYAYNEILSGEMSYIKNENYGYPIEDFLSEFSQEKIKQYCYYVFSLKKAEDLPQLPTGSLSNLKVNGETTPDYSDMQTSIGPINEEERKIK